MSLNSPSYKGSDTYHIAHASMTNAGMRRQSNQDALAALPVDRELWKKRGHFFMVADGMGAHAAGELASKIAVDNVPHTYQKLRDLAPAAALYQAVCHANELIHAKGQSSAEFNGMGTTCSCLVLLPGEAIVAHVGDSRVYRLRTGQLEQLTFDHSLVWEMAAANQSSAEDVPACIPKNVITRSLGPHPTVNVDIEGPYQLQPGDVFLACSDGLTAVVDDRLIGPIIELLPPEEAVETLIHVANLRGGPDNISIVAAKVLTGPVEDGGDASVTFDPTKSTQRFEVRSSFFETVRNWFAGSTTKDTIHTSPRHEGNHSNGPYRFYPCDPEWVCQKLGELAGDLQRCETSPDSPFAHLRRIDWGAFNESCEAGEKATAEGRFSDGIIAYSSAIRHVMSQVESNENDDTTDNVTVNSTEDGSAHI